MKPVIAALGLFLGTLSYSQGVGADWDIVPVIRALSQNSARLTPIVEQLTPPDWTSKGAPDAYIAQWEVAKRELASVSAATQVLERDPEKLTAALEIYFRLELIETQLKTLSEGVRKYQNPAVADLMLSVLSENSISRGRLQRHILDVAEQKEHEFSVIDKEAQRCRTQVIRQVPTRGPAAPAPAPAKKAKQ
jgi:hypothetical protein